jgi:hypothetical protein
MGELEAALADIDATVFASPRVNRAEPELMQGADVISGEAIARNPCHELRRLHEQKRTRYVADQEYLALYSIAADRIQCLMDMATITGQREGDLLKLPNRDPSVYTDEGIVFRPGKSKRRQRCRGCAGSERSVSSR